MNPHDPDQCEDCQVSDVSTNGHDMQVIVPCYERKVTWLCAKCDSIEEFPIVADAAGELQIIKTFMYIHCLDKLVLT